jgi:hypothetical protein
VTISQSIEPAWARKTCDFASYVACLRSGDLPRLTASSSAAARAAGECTATAALWCGRGTHQLSLGSKKASGHPSACNHAALAITDGFRADLKPVASRRPSVTAASVTASSSCGHCL